MEKRLPLKKSHTVIYTIATVPIVLTILAKATFAVPPREPGSMLLCQQLDNTAGITLTVCSWKEQSQWQVTFEMKNNTDVQKSFNIHCPADTTPTAIVKQFGAFRIDDAPYSVVQMNLTLDGITSRPVLECKVTRVVGDDADPGKMATPAPTEERVPKIFSFNDQWHFNGEAVHRPGVFQQEGRYCGLGYCADGYGRIGTDYGWWYWGNFVDGRMTGVGKLTNDFFTYVGSFKDGAFDGHGILTCLDSTSYEGDFDNGIMVGDFRVATGTSKSVRQLSGEEAEAGRNGSGPCPW